MSRLKLSVAGDFKDGAAAGLHQFFRGVDQPATDTLAASILPNDEDCDPADRRISVDRGHQVEAAETHDLFTIGRHELWNSCDAKSRDSPSDAGRIYTVLKQGDQAYKLLRIVGTSGADFRHRLSSACRTSPTRPPTNVPLMRMY